MNARAILGFATGGLLCLSAAAHALGGWPAFDGPLRQSGLDPELRAGLAAGWYFGSVAMLVFAAIVLHAAWRLARGEAIDRVPLLATGIGYAAFGLAAFVLRDFRPHFLLFVLTGALVLAVAGRAQR